MPFETASEYERSCKKGALDERRQRIPHNALFSPIAKFMHIAPVLDIFDNVAKLLVKVRATVID